MNDENNNSPNTTLKGVRRPKKTKFSGNVPADYNVTSRSYLRRDTIKWLTNALKNKELIAVTLTMKQHICRKAKDEIFFGYESLDEISAKKNFNHFMNCLNFKIFGNLFKRKNSKNQNRIEVVPYLEGNINGKTRLHYHVTFVVPNISVASRNKLKQKSIISNLDMGLSDSEIFELLINYCWTNSDFGDEETCIKKIYNLEGWLEYCTKENKFNIDTNNLFLRDIQKN